MEVEAMASEVNPYEKRDQLAKMVIGTIIGFIAKELAEKAYDALVINRR